MAKKTYTWPSGSKGHSISWADQRAKAKGTTGGKFAWPSAPASKTHTRSWEDEQKRIKTAKLAKPIVPGSSLTEGQLASETKAAGDVAFGARQLGEQQTLGEERARYRDVGGFYDQYQKQLAQHAQNIQNIGAQATQAGVATQNTLTGLGAADLTQLNQRATADAAARGATPGDLAQMASNAAAIRQANVKSFIDQQTAQNAASSSYADALANVVAPVQKESARAAQEGQIRKALQVIAETAGERGGKELLYGTERRTAEANQVLAQQVAGGKAAGEAADTAATKTSTAKTKAELDFFKKHGYYPSTGAPKPPAAPSTTGYGSGKTGMNKYGYTYDEWTKLPAKTQNDWRTGKLKPGSKGSGGAGPANRLTTAQKAPALAQIPDFKRYADMAYKGEPFIAGHKKESPRTTRPALEKKLSQWFEGKIKNPAVFRAVVDAVIDKHISAYTANQLHAAGYTAGEIANMLGVPTSAVYKKAHPGKKSPSAANTGAYGKQGNLGKTGHE